MGDADRRSVSCRLPGFDGDSEYSAQRTDGFAEWQQRSVSAERAVLRREHSANWDLEPADRADWNAVSLQQLVG